MFFLSAHILGEDCEKISLFVRNMCQTIIQSHSIFKENTFSDFFVCFSLYQQIISGLYCSERISRKWLQDRPIFGLKRKFFLFPAIRVNLGLFDLADLEKSRKALEDLFGADMWNIFLLLFIKEAVETDHDPSKYLTIMREAAENLEIILAKFFPPSQTDSESTYIDLRSLLEKQLTVRCSYEKSLTCHILMIIWANNDVFDTLTSRAAKLTFSLKINEKHYIYIPCSNSCDVASLQRLTKIFTLEQCKRELKRQYIASEDNRFKGLEALFRDATVTARQIHLANKLPGKIEMMDLDALLRCIFATFVAETKQYVFQIVRHMEAFKKFIAVVTLYFNMLKVNFLYF